jgi:hypothetical protein
MPDWTKSMAQSFEYYTVEPSTLADVKRLDNIKKSSFTRDSDTNTQGSASIDMVNSVGEAYIRCYLKTIQNGVTEKTAIGTMLSQSPSSDFDGKTLNVTVDCYTPLIELQEKRPPLGYTIRKGTRIMDAAYRIIRENCRVPVAEVEPVFEENEAGELVDKSPTLQTDFVANTDDTYLSFVIDLIANARYQLGVGERGDILFMPYQALSALQPIWTYDDGNSSILYPDISMKHDLYGIPNVVEVIYSYGSDYKTAIAINDDVNSPTSTVNRGRKIIYRDTNPSLAGYVSPEQLQAYADRLLQELSTIEYTVSYTHGYCPVRVGDCILLDYPRAGLNKVKAKVISQSIKCEPGCPVSEKAVYTKNLWR